jgi:hypothetical protein
MYKKKKGRAIKVSREGKQVAEVKASVPAIM